MSGFCVLKHRQCLKDVMSVWHCNLIRRLKCSPIPHAFRWGLFLSWSLCFLLPGQNLPHMLCHWGKEASGGARCFFDVDLPVVFFSRRCMASEHVLLLPGLTPLRFAQGCILACSGRTGLNNQSLCCFSDSAYTRISIQKHQIHNTHH